MPPGLSTNMEAFQVRKYGPSTVVLIFLNIPTQAPEASAIIRQDMVNVILKDLFKRSERYQIF